MRRTPLRLGVVAVVVALCSGFGGTAHAAKKTDTVIDTKPPSKSKSSDATFTFHGKPKEATFSCQLDAAATAACDSGTVTYTGLTAGKHAFTVTASAAGVSDKKPPSYTWNVDVAAPTGSGVVYDGHLTRAPYLTDLVGTGVTVNFATDRTQSSASVRYGTVGAGGSCTPTSTVAATSIVVAVGSIYQYQWKARLDFPAGGSYCYRPYLGGVDLLAANPSPVLATQVPAGSNESYSFAVFGDWGQAYAAPGNPNQTNVMSRLAASGVRFAVTTGDNGYPSGSQLNYGDLQQTGADVSAIFGPGQWGVPGASIPVFPTIGNHGLARNDGIHPHLGIWPQDVAVATSGGSYERTSYPSINGSSAASYPSPWYAFDAGNARFYVLDAAWADLNGGSAGPYATEAAAHWKAGAAQYEWLKRDLQEHPSGLKFAFFHYPLYSDQPGESSDTSLQGASSLEGLLVANGVNLAFQGHAHIYQRSIGLGGMVNYLTGGGGAKAQSTGSCSSEDRYAIGWSYTKSSGTSCGQAKAPKSDAEVYHFLKVTVAGRNVTVAPTDSMGKTFDVQTYTFEPAPDTIIDSGPPAGAATTSASFAFHASGSPATFTCGLDGAPAVACTSPKAYTGLAQGPHTLTVTATVGGASDPAPATWSWTVDTVDPSAPGSIAVDAASPFQVDVSWPAASDNTGVTGYDLFRDGSLLATLDAATSYTDSTVVASSTHEYAVRARDVAGNVSGLVSATVTTPAIAEPLFADTFESGSLSGWTSKAGLTVQTSTVHGGSYAAEGVTQNGGTYAKKTLPSTYGDSWSRLWFNVVSQTDQVNLLRLRDQAGASLGYVYVNVAGRLGFHNDSNGTNTLSSTTPGAGWHAVELHLQVGSASGVPGSVEVWLDGARLADLSNDAVDVGSSRVGALQIGEVQAGLTYDVVFDDVAFGTGRIGPGTDTTAPSTPQDLTATAGSARSVHLTWTASTDDVGLASYDVFRDGELLGTVDTPATGYDDSSVSPSTSYSWTVRARDTSGNVSSMSAGAQATTPAAAAAVFADGFESGDLTAWTTSAGLPAQSATVRTGAWAAAGNSPTGVTWAKKSLPGGPFPDAYASVAFRVNSQGSQTTLLRLRSSATGTGGGYLYLTSTGRLAFRSDALASGTLSGVVPSTGEWHVVELHLAVGAAAGELGTVEVWLDGAPVAALSSASVDVGSAPVAVMQIGDTAGNGSGTGWDLVYDDAVFSTRRLGS